MIEADPEVVIPTLTEALVEVEPMLTMFVGWNIRLTEFPLIMVLTEFKWLTEC